MALYDISLSLSPDLPIWPGDPPLEIRRISRIQDGDLANVTHLKGGVHIGTHVDAPDHFLDNGQTIDQLPLELLVGQASLIEIQARGQIKAADLETANIPAGTSRLLIKTANSWLWAQGIREFQQDFIALEPDAAAWLVNHGIQVVGVDYLSVAPYADPAPTHRILLKAGILIIEGLDLSKVEPGSYRLLCLPLKIQGAEGAPARVLLED